MSKRHRPKIRAHRNPLSSGADIEYPIGPDEMNWKKVFPKSSEEHINVKIADVGCGFGELLILLSPIFADEYIVGLEIRPKPVEIVKEKILTHQNKAKEGEHNYCNIGVVLTNFMKHCTNIFKKKQLEKIFFCFQDPHFKRKNIRRRVISPTMLDMYAYAMADEAIVYTITDVKDLHDWQVESFSNHPLFESIPYDMNDPVIQAMCNTDEGKKVSRQGGQKFIALFKKKKTS